VCSSLRLAQSLLLRRRAPPAAAASAARLRQSGAKIDIVKANGATMLASPASFHSMPLSLRNGPHLEQLCSPVTAAAAEPSPSAQRRLPYEALRGDKAGWGLHDPFRAVAPSDVCMSA